MLLLIHVPLNSGSVECTSHQDFLLRLFGNYVYHHFIFSKINKMGFGIQQGLQNFSKLISGGGTIIRYYRV